MKAMKPVHSESKDITDQARDTKASFVYPQAKTKSAGNTDQTHLIDLFFFLFCLGFKLSVRGKILCCNEFCDQDLPSYVMLGF